MSDTLVPMLYDSPISRNGYKARLLASHLALPLRTTFLDILAGETRTPEFLAKNPAGKIPLLELPSSSGEGDPIYIPESNAILCFLADPSPLFPNDPIQRAKILGWLFFEQNNIECSIGTARFWRKKGLHLSRPDAFAHRISVATDALSVLNNTLKDKKWLESEFSIADIALFGYISVAEEAGIEMSEYPNIVAWREKIRALPGHIED